MTTIFLDCNIFIYLKDPLSAYYQQTLNLLARFHSNSKFVTTPYVLNELHYFYLREKNVTVATKRLNNIINSKLVYIKDQEIAKKDLQQIFSISTTYNLKTLDAFHAYYCKKLKIKQIATYDTDFKRIPWLSVIN
jgi:predicted nucleic acid-binding protein